MKTRDIIWYVIIGLWVYAAFTSNQWLGFIVVPLCVGVFLIITSRQQVEDGNAFYEKMSKRIPILFPPSWVEKTPSKVQILITVAAGILFILFAIYSWVVIP